MLDAGSFGVMSLATREPANTGHPSGPGDWLESELYAKFLDADGCSNSVKES